MTDVIEQLPIDQLQPNPLQPRGVITPESLAELVDSIKTHGLIQPLVIANTPAGYQIIAGERRWRASRLAGLTHVPVKIIQTSPQGMLEMAIVENVQRSDLNPIDRANSFDRLMREFSLTNLDIATRTGKSPSYVSNSLRLLELPDALKDGLISGVITEGHARALAAIPETQAMIEAYKIILREGGSVRRAEELARRFKKHMGSKTKVATNDMASKSINDLIDQLSSQIQTSIGKNAHVKMRRSRVETAISIVLRGKPEETEQQLKKICVALSGETSNGIKDESVEEIISETPTVNAAPAFTNPFEPILPIDSPKDEFEDY
ncbi:MAG: ParB/RepB/Spo0J family partition protein [Microgenomates group bacterium]